MKLQTAIKPRRDGTVRAIGPGGKAFVFEADATGELSCDVTDEATASLLLSTGNFWPADQADLETALAMVQGQSDDQDDDSDPDDEDEDLSALPLEAETPPAPKNPKKQRHKAE